MRIGGWEKYRKELGVERSRWLRAAAAALYQEGFWIIGLAVLRTPVDYGRLRSSAYCGPPVQGGSTIWLVLGYGADYAAAVHARHPTKAGREATDKAGGRKGRKAGERLFLKKALMQSESGWHSRMTARVTRNINANVGVNSVSVEYPKTADAGKQKGEATYQREKARRGKGKKRRRKKRGRKGKG